MATPTSSPAAARAAATDSEPVWVVPLHDHHPYYDRVCLRRVFAHEQDRRHRVVVVDAVKLLACAERDETDYVLPPVGQWHGGKARGIREFLDPDNPRMPTMPYVTIVRRRARGLLGMLGLEHVGVVSFRNGQHRARYLAHAGARSFPVEVHEREASLLMALCGASESVAVPQ